MTPHIRLLGRLRVHAGEDAWEPPSNLTVALLVYVAYQGAWVDRSALAAVFWPEADQSRALTNLRTLLARTKREPFAQGLEVETTRVRWSVLCDARSLQAAFDDERWSDAVEAYGGAFLQGMAFDVSPTFDSWLHLNRQNLEETYQSAALHLAKQLRHAGEIESALGVVRDLLRREPLHEAATQLAMHLHQEAGRPGAAERTYRAFAERLNDELDLEPTSATTSLHREIQRGMPVWDALSATATDAHDGPSPNGPGALPPALTGFIGREQEIATIIGLLERDDCRLVTITGPGGVGKTRLATVATERLQDRYGRGAAFVQLDRVATTHDVPAAIAAALGLRLQSRDPTDVQLVRSIGDRHLLLVLDNFEHLVDAADLVSRLLVMCPRLDVLVTSRERLGLPAERLVDLRGLPYPDGTPSPDEAEHYPAVAMMFARVRQVRANVPVDPATVSAVAQTCRLVRGLPLALELAAVWANSVPLDDIAREIARNLDFLSFGPAAAKGRHRSVRAAFEHSWKLLTPTERGAMRRLSVFRGGFRRSAAAFVAGASIPVLAALADKSLLRVSLDGRYDCHSLIRAFAREKLQGDPEEANDARARHAEYFAWLLDEAEPHRGFERQAEWSARLRPEAENFSDALDFAMRDADECGELALRLLPAMRWNGWPDAQVETRYRTVVEALRQSPSAPPSARAHALHIAGVLAVNLRDLAAAKRFDERALALSDATGNPVLATWLRTNLATIALISGDEEEARAHLESCLALRHEVGAHTGVASALNHLATLERRDGNLEAAHDIHAEALDIGRLTKDSVTICRSLNGLGYTARASGDLERANTYLREGMAVAAVNEHHASAIAASHALAGIAREAGDLARSARLHEDALRLEASTSTYRLLHGSLESVGDLLSEAGAACLAAKMWGAAQKARSQSGAQLSAHQAEQRRMRLERARSEVDPAAFDDAYRAGLGLSARGAIDAALQALGRVSSPRRTDDRSASPAEHPTGSVSKGS